MLYVILHKIQTNNGLFVILISDPCVKFLDDSLKLFHEVSCKHLLRLPLVQSTADVLHNVDVSDLQREGFDEGLDFASENFEVVYLSFFA